MSEIWYYIDERGLFGVPGDLISDRDLIEYWNENYASDPCLGGYNSFTEWYNETRANLKRVN